jgi:hypothetical protein
MSMHASRFSPGSKPDCAPVANFLAGVNRHINASRCLDEEIDRCAVESRGGQIGAADSDEVMAYWAVRG